MKRFLVYAPLVLLLMGCVQSSATRLSPTAYTPTTEDDVVVYFSEAEIPGDYERVALVFVKGHYNVNDARFINKAKKKAASMGANGIVMADINEPSKGAKVANYLFGTTANKKGQMLAVYVKRT